MFIEFSHCIYTGLKEHVAARPNTKKLKLKSLSLYIVIREAVCTRSICCSVP